MTPDTLHDLLKQKLDEGYGALVFAGVCHDCGQPVEVRISVEPAADDQWPMTITGGALYHANPDGSFSLKCEACFETAPVLRNQPCEVYSRVVGYLRPVSQWNAGKQAEFASRVNYRTDALCACR